MELANFSLDIRREKYYTDSCRIVQGEKMNRLSQEDVFVGSDWAELANHWNIPNSIPQEMVEECVELNDSAHIISLLVMAHFFSSHKHSKQTFVRRKMMKDCRNFLRKMEKNYEEDSYAEAWRGMAKMKDDFSLLILTIRNIDLMWN